MTKRILLIYTGGTIGMAKDYSDNSLRPFDFQNISQQIPELALIDADLFVASFDEPKDSSDVNPQDWNHLANLICKYYDDYHGFVILHGTDTMAYSASALSFMLQGLQKPIIFTGSQLPIGDLRTDAKENLISSIHFAALYKQDQPVIKEVCIYFEYKLYRANRTTKLNANHFDAFTSPNFPILGESGVHMTVLENNFFVQAENELSIIPNFSDEVALLKIYPGISDSFLSQIIATPNLKVLIIESFGSGNIFTREKFEQELIAKVQEGLKVVVTTQCLGGAVELGLYSSSQLFIACDAISAHDMTTETAIIKSMFLLGNPEEFPNFRESFEQNLRGECQTSSIIFTE